MAIDKKIISVEEGDKIWKDMLKKRTIFRKI